MNMLECTYDIYVKITETNSIVKLQCFNAPERFS